MVGEVVEDDVVVVPGLLGDDKSRGGDGDFLRIENPANWLRLRCRAAIASEIEQAKNIINKKKAWNHRQV